MSNGDASARQAEAPPGFKLAFDALADKSEARSRNAWNVIVNAGMRTTRLWNAVGRRALAGGLVTIFGWPIFAASPADRSSLVSADTGFAFGLLKELVKEQPANNVFISPYSISTVLQMVCNGAAGTTRDQMAQVLGTSGLEPVALNQAFKDLDTSVRSAQTNVALNIANAIWYSAGIEVKPAFASLNKDFYGATMDALDFANPGAAGIVNAWAEKNTSGRIKNIIAGRLPGDTRMVLANAIYFKGSWDRKFDPKATKERPFHLLAGRPEATPHDAADRRVRVSGGQRLPGRAAPVRGAASGDVCPLARARLQREHVARHVDQPGVAEPASAPTAATERHDRFASVQAGVRRELKPPLQAMGLTLPFNRTADFSGMSASALYLSAVKHKSFVEVNEEGTEAAAATVGIVSLAVVRPVTPPFEMVVDHPFLFLIADNLTRAILFVGVVFEPASVAG